jgi:Cd2+/Zn2+-exporting ATPase
VALDKTGTLTQGEFSVQQFKLTEKLQKNRKMQRKEILEYLALAESCSSHPIATAVNKFLLAKENIVVPATMSVSDHNIQEGEGMVATINGKVVHVGNARLFQRIGLYDQLSSEEQKHVRDWAADGATIGFMSIEGEGIVCYFAVADSIRPEAPLVIDELRNKLGLEVYMLTGDLKDSAESIGKQANIPPENIRSNLTPEQKLQIIAELREKASSKGKLVLMCGDGGMDNLQWNVLRDRIDH